jgi:hypothetical protein
MNILFHKLRLICGCLGKRINVKYGKTIEKYKPLGLEMWGLWLHIQELTIHLAKNTVEL